ncbi:hypothetical protein FHW58_001075 [Duganella sp. 1224]|uniref:hypothetical protein n=1 Tax=Duganella sp. 1224 TaxID=2587052 RepID=UPI0015C8694D|nr:hypothetical protein [Duganella sp. 1224]NYE59923.1 hypothetical protein [Duganella sp. 1224]
MTDSYSIFRDDTGRLQITPGPGGDVLVADFLQTDIRDSTVYCDLVLAMLKRNMAGRHSEQDRTIGNIYRLDVNRDQATLTNIHDEQAPAASIASADLLALMQQWRAHLPDRP